MSRPFLFFITRDETGRHVLKVQGPGIPLTEQPIGVEFCLLQARAFTQAAIEIRASEQQEKGKGA